MLPPNDQHQIEQLSRKIASGEASEDELRQAVALIRRSRPSATAASAAARAKRAGPVVVPNGDDLLKGLMEGL